MDKKHINFIIEHENDDTSILRLSSTKYPDINIALAASAIDARKKLKSKIPLWYSMPELEYPSNTLPVQQCSSQVTALYKSEIIPHGLIVADLTGGLGVDTFFLAKVSAHVDYYERDAEYCRIAEHNFSAISSGNISVFNQNINSSLIDNMAINKYSLIYIDPARRALNGAKIADLSQCEPDVTILQNHIFKVTNKLLIKISPMSDISAAISSILYVKEIHVVAVENECREVLLLCEKGYEGEPMIKTVNFTSGDINHRELFDFYISSEKRCASDYFHYKRDNGRNETNGNDENDVTASSPLFLYEPNKAILKSGAFKSVGESFGLKKISADSHLYVSRNIVKGFPGKVYKIERIEDFNHQLIRSFSLKYPQGVLKSVNFPIRTEELRKRLKIEEGDDAYFFATRWADGSKVIIVTRKISC